MAKPAVSLAILSLFLLLLSLNLGGTLVLADDQQRTWCVAKASSSDMELKANVAYACNSVDCSLIQEGGRCFHPNTLINHASVAMNIFYQKSGRHTYNCDFRNSALITVIDPSYDGCKYEFEVCGEKLP